MTKNSALAFLFSCALCACSSSSGDSTENTADGAACPNLAGNWTVSTHCDMSLVGQTATVTQTNCSLSFAPPFDGFTGSVTSAGQITLAGPQSCTGTAAMSALSLSCTPGTCTVSLTRRQRLPTQHDSFDGATWQVADLDSRNGTFVNGSRVAGNGRVPSGSTVRLGGAILSLVADILPFKRYGLDIRDGKVGSPPLRKALECIVNTQQAGMINSLLVIGESGTGKELLTAVGAELIDAYLARSA